eukprot:84578_1
MSGRKKKKKKKKHRKKTSRSTNELPTSTNTANTHSPQSSTRKIKRKTSSKPKDKHKPKRSASSYLLFSNEVRPSHRAKHADKPITEIAKLIGKQWKTMSEQQKQPYKQQAVLLRQEYEQRLTEYKQSTHYKQYQTQLREWQQTQPTKSKHKPLKKSKKQPTKSTKSPNKKRKKRKKRVHHNHESDSSLSSNLSEIDPIFASDSSELSEEFDGIDLVQHLCGSKKKSTQINAMSIVEAVLNKSIGREMPSTIASRTQQVDNDDDEDNDDASEEKGEDTFFCRMCVEPFDDLNALQEHEKQLHIKQCTQCELRFRTATCLEKHMYEKHDVYATDAMEHNDDRMRVDQYGNFKMNQSISTQRFIYNNSRYRQGQRMRQQMAAITDRVVIDKDDALKRKKRERITVQSYLKKKRHNMGRSMKWTNKDTRRFYQCLKYSGLNFMFMEVLYNRAISNEEYAQIEQAIDDKTKTETDEKKEKKKKKWVYRDAKALKQKYYREEKHNKDTITRITKSAKFTKEISNKIDELVKKNEFHWKDEEYYEDSDVEMEKLYKKEEKKGDDEDMFDPLAAFEDEIEEDRREKKEMKRIKDERLEAWRRKEETIAQEKLMQFKQEYEEYKRIKEKGMSVEDHEAMMKKTEKEECDANTNGMNEEIMQEEEGENDDNNVGESFDPFATLSDHDSDDDVNAYDSDESDPNDSKRKEGQRESKMNDIQDDDYDDYYQSDGMHDFDIDADPFE